MTAMKIVNGKSDKWSLSVQVTSYSHIIYMWSPTLSQPGEAHLQKMQTKLREPWSDPLPQLSAG